MEQGKVPLTDKEATQFFEDACAAQVGSAALAWGGWARSEGAVGVVVGV